MKQQRTGNLLVILDLTESRADSLREAREATALMLAAVGRIGSIALRLVYYRGSKECRAMEHWQTNPDIVTRAMLKQSCKAGSTQIAKALGTAFDHKERRPSGVVFIGDNCEDDEDKLRRLSTQLAKEKIPLFVFHEMRDDDERCFEAKPIFKEMASRSGGVYSEFRLDSARVLEELLTVLAGFLTAGAVGVEELRAPSTKPALELKKKLLQLPPPKKPDDEWR